MGLAKLLAGHAENQIEPPVVDDINRILNKLQKEYGALENLPYSEIIQSVVQFQGRRRRT